MYTFQPFSFQAILAAVTEVIKDQGGEETSTEYFAALLTTLEATDTEEGMSAVVSLLSMVIKTVPQEVIRSRFSKVSSKTIAVSFGSCRDPVVCPAPFTYIVWQKVYLHPFPLTVGILSPLNFIIMLLILFKWTEFGQNLITFQAKYFNFIKFLPINRSFSKL